MLHVPRIDGMAFPNRELTLRSPPRDTWDRSIRLSTTSGAAASARRCQMLFGLHSYTVTSAQAPRRRVNTRRRLRDGPLSVRPDGLPRWAVAPARSAEEESAGFRVAGNRAAPDIVSGVWTQ